MHSRYTMRRFWTAALLGLVLAGLPACQNPRGELIRVTTEPSDANFFVPRLGLQGTMPYEFAGMKLSDTIVITKEGYRPWERSVGELPKVAEGSYKLELERRK
jgi:hypothetical protein